MKEVYGNQKEDAPTCSTYRARVPGGWLVAIWAAPTADKKNKDTNRQTFAGGVTFVLDPTHKWALDDHRVQ